MTTPLTTSLQQVSAKLTGSLRALGAGLFALLLLAAVQPAQAQMEDGELPKIDLGVNLMQSAQYLSLSVPNADTDPVAGFHRVRAGINANVQFAEGVSGLVMIQQEPNDFGGVAGPAIDFAILNVSASSLLTIQAGTPVTGLINFRGYSDGPVVQGNPLIGNSPADMITAGQGVKLIGAGESFGFDVTVAKGFFGQLTGANGAGTGLELIAKAKYTGSDLFKFGAGAATATGQESLNFAGGDGNNYALSRGVASAPTPYSGNGLNAIRNTHAGIPGQTIVHADAKITAGSADADLWGGYGSNSDADAAAAFGGVGVKFDVSDSFYLAGRFTAVSDQGDAASNAPDDFSTTLTRIQAGIGYFIADTALLKVEGVSQSHGDGGLTRPAGADSFAGVLTELSFNF